MKREAEIKALLINNTIHLIAVGDFEKATTKELTYSNGDSLGIKMNEVYIYRLFGSKENLYEAAFIYLNNELFYALQRGIEAVGGFAQDFKDKLYQLFLLAWKLILSNEEYFKFYVRFYHSIYFKEHSLQSHKKLFERLAAEMAPFFKEEADVVSILHIVSSALLDFGIRVYNGDLEDGDINTPHIFNVLYCMMATYFKE